tara:strand:- start:158 stop:283 length:126 start_codon:yes stop_codon:yes gene_type:complete
VRKGDFDELNRERKENGSNSKENEMRWLVRKERDLVRRVPG